MKTLALFLFAALIVPGLSAASGPELIGLSYSPGRPLPSDRLEQAVDDGISVDRAISHDLGLLRRLPSISFQINGYTDGQECAAASCKDLALRRAHLFRLALIRAGAPTTRICDVKAQLTPWPSTYQPKQEELFVGRQVIIEPVFDGCA